MDYDSISFTYEKHLIHMKNLLQNLLQNAFLLCNGDVSKETRAMEYVSDSGIIQFRHPVIMDGKYGLVVKKSIGRLPSMEQAAVDDDLVWLHAVKPLTRGAAAKMRTLHPRAADMWFAPIEAQDREREAFHLWCPTRHRYLARHGTRRLPCRVSRS